jgi:hypothetical protein
MTKRIQMRHKQLILKEKSLVFLKPWILKIIQKALIVRHPSQTEAIPVEPKIFTHGERRN